MKAIGSSAGRVSPPRPTNHTARPAPTARSTAPAPSANRCFVCGPVVQSYSGDIISNTVLMKRVLATVALAGFVAALVVIAFTSASGGGGDTSTTTAPTTRRTVTTRPTTTAAQPTARRPVKLSAVGAYDPEGDDTENDDLAPLAVDGDSSTFWKTEHYTHGFFKKGVGLILDAAAPRKLSRVVVTTDAAGSKALIQLGRNPNGPFRAVSKERPLNGRTVFPLVAGAAGRYVVVWITGLPSDTGEAHVTEVQALGS
jgi:hypothetical protein